MTVRRLTVKECLGNIIVAYDADGSEVRQPIPPAYSDIVRLLAEGDVINVVSGCQDADGSDIIIYQPDYLVDISSVASCFESYADTPYISLLSKIRSLPPSRYILLGNLASQFLDEQVHGSNISYAESITRYFHQHALDMAVAEGIDASFHRDAQRQRENIRIAVHETLEHHVPGYDASKVLLEPSFFCEALGLQGRMDLLQSDYKVLIEQKSGKGALFRSAGAQAGEAQNSQADPDTPIYQEKHYVQMLLYRAILNTQPPQDSHPVPSSLAQQEERASFLLYSKYANGLVRLEGSPSLLHRAIMLRNQIAYLEMSYARGGAEVLLTMKPEQLRRKPMSDRFWLTWVRPELDKSLSTLQSASPLAQAYFLRMFRFVATEHLLSKMVRKNEKEENTGFAAKWHTSLEEKKNSGSILTQLRITQTVCEEGAITKLWLSAPSVSHNFRLGDIVVLYAYGVTLAPERSEDGSEPDIRSGIVHRGSIEQIGTTPDGQLSVLFRLRSPLPDNFNINVNANSDSNSNSNSNSNVNSDQYSLCKWDKNGTSTLFALEHDFYESSTTSLYRSLHQLLSAPAERQDLLLSQRPPRFDTSRTLIGNYGQFNDLVLRAVQALDYYLVVGPPGTGKTSFALLNILKEQLLQDKQAQAQQSSVLLLSFTNRAVDEISSKLVSEGLDFIRISSALSCEPAYRPYLLENKTHHCKNVEEVRQLLASTPIIVGTTTSVASASLSLFRLKSFSLAIIDEASQILEPHLMGLLSGPISKFVLIGDHKQLPAVVQQSEEESRVTHPLLLDIGLTNCRNSLFERLYNSQFTIHSSQFLRSSRCSGEQARSTILRAKLSGEQSSEHNSQLKPQTSNLQPPLQLVGLPEQETSNLQPQTKEGSIFFLSAQARMHSDIADFPNQAFYDGKLRVAGLAHQLEPSPTPRMRFIPVRPSEDHSQSDKINLAEARVIAHEAIRVIREAGSHYDPQQTLGIIVPYRSQIEAVRQALSQFTIQPSTLTIDTVERYQGSQRDVIIYGFTARYEYQLKFLTSATFTDPLTGALIDRRLNVALTRARKEEIIVGNPDLLSHAPVFRSLLDYCKHHGCFTPPPHLV